MSAPAFITECENSKTFLSFHLKSILYSRLRAERMFPLLLREKKQLRYQLLSSNPLLSHHCFINVIYITSIYTRRKCCKSIFHSIFSNLYTGQSVCPAYPISYFSRVYFVDFRPSGPISFA